MTTCPRLLLRALAVLLPLAAAAGCGGGGGGGGGGAAPPPPPAPLTLNITRTEMSDGLINQSYSLLVDTVGGTGQRTFTISAGALPAGLSIDMVGFVTGTPTGPLGVSNFTVTVRDSGTPQQTDSQALSMRIIEPLQITTATLADAPVGVTYNQAVVATGGVQPYSFTIAGNGVLPAGLTLSSSGIISGQPTAAAFNQSFTVRVEESSNLQLSATRAQTIVVPLEILTTSLPDAEGFVFYSQPLVAQGGTAQLTWGLASGSLPNGNMNVSSSIGRTGAIFGTPNGVCSDQTSAFRIFAANDGSGPGDTQDLSLTVNAVPLEVSAAPLPDGSVGIPYSTMVRTRGGALAFNFSIDGALPDGLAINALEGRISGTPISAGTWTFDVDVTDGCGAMESQTLEIAIQPTGSGRNDSIATATPLGNGTFNASISPSGPSNTVFSPDQDYYVITTTAAATISVRIYAAFIGSPLDSVIEFVNASGNRLNTCVPPDYNSSCMNDDINPGIALDSQLAIRVNSATTFYIRVVDWRGDARPDLLYAIEINGVL